MPETLSIAIGPHRLEGHLCLMSPSRGVVVFAHGSGSSRHSRRNIVGGADPEVMALNRSALDRLRCKKQLKIVPRATHLFEETGALDVVASLAGAWFLQHLGPVD